MANRVSSVNEANFPGAGPVLYVYLPLSCGEDVWVVLGIDQPKQAVSLGNP